MRFSLGLGFVGVAAFSAIATQPGADVAAATQTSSQDLAVDAQAYVPDNGPDAYETNALSGGNSNGPDPTSIHVAAAPQKSTYHSLLHVNVNEVSTLNPGASVTFSNLIVTLYVDPNSQDNANESNALLVAYPLKSDIPSSFTGCPSPPAPCSEGTTYPAYDNGVTPVAGQRFTDAQHCPSQNPAGAPCWQFQIGSFLGYWQQHNDVTGFAVVGNFTSTTQPFTVGFDRTLSVASATVTITSSGTAPAPVHSSGGSTAAGGGVIGGAASVPTSAAPTTSSHKPLPTQASQAPTTGVTQGGTTGIPVWLLVLAVSGVGAVALLAQPVSQALSGSMGLKLGLLHELSLHPRIAAVSSGLVVWSSAWGVYSGVTGPHNNGGVIASVGGANGQNIPGYSPDTGTSPTGGPSTSGGASGGRSVNGHPLGAAAFAGQGLNVPSLNLYNGADNVVGVTNTTVQMCAHAALTFGTAFSINPSDLNVFWQMVDDPGDDPYPHTAGQAGIFNRNIVQPDGNTPGIAIQDDGYQPNKAVQAAQSCQQQTGGDFFLLSGIGFDQIPAVRTWAEQNHMIYVHHIATQQGTGGLQFSYTMLPTLEQVGTQFGQYYVAHMRGQKIGIIER
ncbi:MAG: hypothetical protein ABR498_08330, partial [Candidatus Dormibacteria bacterium]